MGACVSKKKLDDEDENTKKPEKNKLGEEDTKTHGQKKPEMR